MFFYSRGLRPESKLVHQTSQKANWYVKTSEQTVQTSGGSLDHKKPPEGKLGKPPERKLVHKLMWVAFGTDVLVVQPGY